MLSDTYKPFMLSAIMLNAIMLNAIMLSPKSHQKLNVALINNKYF